MSPEQGRRRQRHARSPAEAASLPSTPSSEDPHDVVYFRRHPSDDPAETVPGQQALRSWPGPVRVKFFPVLIAIAKAPPVRFAGGGKWEAMHGEMQGLYEVRVDGRRRHHYRLYCLLDYEAIGRDKPLLVVLDGRDKPFQSVLDDKNYRDVRDLADEYLSRNPRSLG